MVRIGVRVRVRFRVRVGVGVRFRVRVGVGVRVRVHAAPIVCGAAAGASRRGGAVCGGTGKGARALPRVCACVACSLGWVRGGGGLWQGWAGRKGARAERDG